MAWYTLLSAAKNAGKRQLHLEFTLSNGQCFGWRKVFVETVAKPPEFPHTGTAIWRGVIGEHVFSLVDVDDEIKYNVCPPPAEAGVGSLNGVLQDYFQLHEDLPSLYASWGSRDPRMATICEALPGMRIIRQDPWECLVSFICSSNNNIQRITQMVNKIRAAYGTPICTIEGAAYFTFPTVQVMFERCTTEELRALGLGYRADMLFATVRLLQVKGGETIFARVRGGKREEVSAFLQEFHGVGPKVADCVALFSMDVDDCIPVDTHVRAIANRYLDASLKEQLSLTPKVYAKVGDAFRDRYSPKSGWAHSLLFAAELPYFRKFLPPSMITEMEEVRTEERKVKLEQKEQKVAGKVRRSADDGTAVRTSTSKSPKRPRKGSSAGAVDGE